MSGKTNAAPLRRLDLIPGVRPDPVQLAPRVRASGVAGLFRLVLAFVVLVLGPSLPNIGGVFVITLAVFCAGYALLLTWMRARARTVAELQRAERASLTADISLVAFAFFVFAPDTSWAPFAAGFLVIARAGLRFRNGGLLAAASLSLAYAVIVMFSATELGIERPLMPIALQLASYIAAGALMGAVLPEVDAIAVNHRAMHDPLTGLANRELLEDRLRSAITVAHRQLRTVSVLLLDLDGFKTVNDTFGHAAGDDVLVEVARRLQATLRGSDSASRLGGDEFVVVLPATPLEGAVETARAICAAISEPMAIGSEEHRVGVSVGIAVYPTHGTDADSVLAAADVAMYEAKRDCCGWGVSRTPAGA